MEFKNFESLIERIEKDLGSDFNKNFRGKRKKLAGLKKLPNQIIFSEFDQDKSEWVYNRGGKKEIQYHIYLRNYELGYGLGINSQRGSFNNDNPKEIANSLGNSFKELYSEITKILPNYTFKIGTKDQLGKMEEGEFVLFGNSIPYNNDNKLDDLNYQILLDDLKMQFEVYEKVFELNASKRNVNFLRVKEMEERQKRIDLLKYKKQIILQGPPGTGKTKLAKEIAESILGLNEKVEIEIFREALKTIKKIPATNNNNSFHIESFNNDIINFKESTSDEKFSYSLTELYDCYVSNDYLKEDFVKYPQYSKRCSVLYILDKYIKEIMLEQFKLIQFHPSYTYEDFVRGIVSKPNKNGDGIVFNAENKVLGKFIEKALSNLNNSKKAISELSLEKWLNEQFDKFIFYISEKLEKEERIELTESVFIVELDDDAFRYKGLKGWNKKGNRMLFKDIIQAYLDENFERQDIKNNKNLSGLAKWHASYYVRVLDMFKSYLKEKDLIYKLNPFEKEKLKNYVLIIDEINRANLSSVLGELIYALEYRGEAVESMYAVDEDSKLILPPNLYIIGTMNTADRSVGHIDYAIRRRFAFVDVLPENLKEKQDLEDFHEVLFVAVEKLFKEHTSPEFEVKDVQLGHSYFIDKSNEDNGAAMDIRFDYEIKPILLEYVKDGVLIGKGKDIKKEIEELKTLL